MREELGQCQRYYCQFGGVVNSFQQFGYTSTGVNMSTNLTFPVSMRVPPMYALVGTMTLTNVSAPTVTTGLCSVSLTFVGTQSMVASSVAENTAGSYLTFSDPYL